MTTIRAFWRNRTKSEEQVETAVADQSIPTETGKGGSRTAPCIMANESSDNKLQCG